MSCDPEKLISAVEKRPVIYNYKLSDHKNRGAVDKAWEEVATEMDCSVSDCKIKWTNLRSSYNRVMRDSETPSGSRGGKKRKWYLLEAMQFLRDFTSSHRSSLSNEENQETDQDTTQDSTQQTSEEAVEESYVEEEAPSTPASAGEKRKPQSVAHKVAEPMIEYLKSKTGGREKENPMLTFFRSSVDELGKLSDPQKRAFKLDFLKLVDKYVSEAEQESILVFDVDSENFKC